MTKRFRLSLFVYSLICDIPVCFCLCFTSALVNATDLDSGVLTITFTALNWLSILLNFGVALVLSLCISNFIPLTAIGRWFTGLFKVPNETYTNNIRYRLLSTLIISLIFFVIVSPSLTVLNWFIVPAIKGEAMPPLRNAWISFVVNAPFMIVVGFISSLISDIGAWKVAHQIDETF